MLLVSLWLASGAADAASGPPPVPGPGGGVYLGAWVNPGDVPATGVVGGNEFQQVPTFDQQMGRSMAILHLYTSWKGDAPVSSLQTISGQFGAIPLLDWHCGDSNTNIAAGVDDAHIYQYAKALQSYGLPVFLRWNWEMNLPNSAHLTCQGTPSDFVAAWQRIWKIFHGQLAVAGKTIDASNVAFVWCPGTSNSTYPSYYPGNSYVDWIAADGYSHGTRKPPSFSAVFGAFYNWAQAQNSHAPVMIAETGSGNTATGTTKAALQQTYLNGAAQTIGAGHPMPAVEAFVYFDAVGPAGSWVLEPGAGFNAFKTLGGQFTFVG
jgi:hypothetical protein